MKKTFSSIWKNKKDILEGVKNTIIKNQFIEEVSLYRMEICNQCSLKGDDCVVPGTKPCCNECGCSLKFKTRSLSSSCPHPEGSKWVSILTEEEEDKLDNLKD